jgi:hypothetical protein
MVCNAWSWIVYGTVLITGAQLPLVAQTAVAADKSPAYTTLAEAGDDYFLQGEYAGSLNSVGAAGLQIIAEGKGTYRAYLLPGGLPGAGWNHADRIELVGRREASTLTLRAPGAGEASDSFLVTIGMAVVRDGAGRQIGLLRRTLRTSPSMGLQPPAGAIVLFDGKLNGELVDGKISPTGYLMHGVTTKRPVEDFHLHLEFKTPFMPEARGQARGNSGVYIQQRYEVQILDSFGLPGETNECGGLYKTKRPDVNMCLPPLVWQTYDIDFQAARFDAQGRKVADARLTVVQNGVTVQNYVDIPNKTGGGKPEGPEPLPILLQNHGNPVEFRNVWMVAR